MTKLSEELKRLTDSIASTIIVLDPKTRNVVYVNAEGCRLFSCSPNGQLPPEIMDLMKGARSDAGTVLFKKRTLQWSCKNFETQDLEYLVFSLTDITELIRVKWEHSLLKNALDNIPGVAVMICDTDEKIILYNKFSSEMDGIPQKAAENISLTSFLGEKEAAKDNLRVALKKEPNDIISVQNYTYQLLNKKQVTIDSVVFPIYEDQQLLGACSFYQISKRGVVFAPISNYIEQRHAEYKLANNGTRYSFNDIVGNSRSLKKCISLAQNAARFDLPVLIYGETGCGKELFAQGIHNAGQNSSEPFIAINCAAIPETLLESTLFGTVKGAYTGAENTEGLFEQARNGTLFLDEVNSMPVALQSKLLRVIQERNFRRIGGKQTIHATCRIISSTNVTAEECMSQKLLRPDLFYRLSSIYIQIPPLRERQEDIVLLAEYFVHNFKTRSGLQINTITPEAIDALLQYEWPGNVRELKHTIESAFVVSNNGETEITYQNLPSNIKKAENPQSVISHPEIKESLRSRVERVEKNAILTALRQCNGNVSATARELQCTQAGLVYKIEKYGIIPAAFKYVDQVF